MRNPIVKKFYSLSEKWGLKKHKHSDEELAYLDQLIETERCRVFWMESTYNMRRVRRKLLATKIILAILSANTLYFFIALNFGAAWLMLAMSLFSAWLMIRLKNKADIHNMSQAMFRAAHKTLIEKIFK